MRDQYALTNYTNLGFHYSLLVQACAQRPGIQYLDYGDTAMASFVDAGGGWVRFAPHFRRLVNTFLIVSQLLSNSVYVLFMAQNIQPVRFIHYSIYHAA